MGNYNGDVESVRRRYDSLKGFIAKNEVYKVGDILCVSVNNDGNYDLFLYADGKSKFSELYKRYRNGGSTLVPPGTIGETELTDELREKIEAGGGGHLGPSTVGSDEIIDGGVHMEDLDDDVKEGLDELNNISLTDEELEEIFTGESTEEAGSGSGTVSDGGAELPDE